MISREVNGTTVPSYREVCGREKIKVYLGYNNEPGQMKVKDNKLLQYPAKMEPKGEGSEISRNWEVLDKFFSIYNVEPIWLNCGYSWGWYDQEQGAWTGCMGKV